ncbi:MAG: hypothetical protein IJO57_03005 [Bacilli bacterium]|nr:hypothetical protein [Bacilli bacterium]
MVTKYKERIEVEKEVLNALPRNNPKNISTYKEKVKELLEQSIVDKSLLENEISKRYKAYIVENDTNINDIDNEINSLYKKLPLCNKYSSSYEKSNLNKLLYKLGHFYTENLEEINKTILEIINIFKEVNIILTEKDFNYSYYSNLYMKEFLKNINDTKIDNSILTEHFKTIYWKCPDLITHITLNFKYLYYLNEKKFNTYYETVIIKLTEENIEEKYRKLTEEKENIIENSKYILLNKFLNKELDINNYTEDKIKNSYKAIFSNTTNENVVIELKKLSNILYEYQKYLDLNYIIEKIKKLWTERDKYKNIVVNKKKELLKVENELFSQNKKIYNSLNTKSKGILSLFKKKEENKTDYYNNLSNELIKKINVLYSELEENIFLEEISKLNENNNLYDILSLFASDYNYLVNTIKKEEKDLDEEINKLNQILYFPYINILNNILISEERDVVYMIIDRFNLFGFDISKEELEKESLDATINHVSVILNSILMNKLDITLTKIKFIENAKSILESVSN